FWFAGFGELIVSPNRRNAADFLASLTLIALCFGFYYLVFLPQYPEHRALAERMTLSWRYSLPTATLAYCPVLVLALSRANQWNVAFDAKNRFLIAWALASL